MYGKEYLEDRELAACLSLMDAAVADVAAGFEPGIAARATQLAAERRLPLRVPASRAELLKAQSAQLSAQLDGVPLFRDAELRQGPLSGLFGAVIR